MKVLLGTELGEGWGHLAILRPLAERFVLAGWRVTLALPGAALLQETLIPDGVTLLDVPRVEFGSRVPFRSFVDLLFESGMSEPRQLQRRVEFWRGALREGYSAVVGNHAPYLLLAAEGSCPACWVGTGFELPPLDEPSVPAPPALFARGGPDTIQPVLAGVSDWRRSEGRRPPATIAGMFAHCTPFVVTIPELDPYARWRKRTSFGPLEPLGRGSQGVREGVVSYLSVDSPSALPVLGGLAKLGRPYKAYFRSATASHWKWLHPRVQFEPTARHLEFRRALENACLVVHHGGLSVCQEALFAGTPQLIVPRSDEQLLNGQAVRALKAGQVLRRPHGDLVQRIATEWLEDAGHGRDCEETARRLVSHWPGSAARDIVQHCGATFHQPP